MKTRIYATPAVKGLTSHLLHTAVQRKLRTNHANGVNV